MIQRQRKTDTRQVPVFLCLKSFVIYREALSVTAAC